MKVLKLLGIFLLVSNSAYAGFTHRQTPTRAECTTSCTSKTITFSSTPVAGNVIVLTLLWYDGTNNTAGTVTCDDNGGGHSLTVTTVSNSRPTTAGLVYFCYAVVASGTGSTLKANFNTTGVAGQATIWASEFTVASGTASFDVAAQGTGTIGTTINTPTANTTTNPELLYSAALSDHQVSTVDSPWTQVAAGAGTNQFSEGIGYILGASSNTAVAMTQNVTSGWDSASISFKFTSSSTPNLKNLLLLNVGGL